MLHCRASFGCQPGQESCRRERSRDAAKPCSWKEVQGPPATSRRNPLNSSPRRRPRGAGSGGRSPPVQDTLQRRRSPQERRMVELTRVICPLQHKKEASLLQSRAKAALREQLQGQWCPGQQAEMEPLRGKARPLQREWDISQGHLQDNLGKLQAREWPAEKQSPDLLLHQYQLLQDKLSYYEEVTQQQELELSQQQDRDRHLQEQLAQAQRTVGVLESSLDLYKKKYQASLGRAGALAEELASQAKERDKSTLHGRCCQVARGEDTFTRLAQELRGTPEELAQGRHLASQCEETIQELQEQLAASHTKVLDQEEALAVLQRELATYKATHAYSNSSYESQVLNADTLRQKLMQVEGESSNYQRQAEEYQALVQELKWELARVDEEKHSTQQDMARLELEIQSLRMETAAKCERQLLEAADGQQRVQQLEAELHQSRQLCAQKEQAIQKRDELLRKSQLEIVHARSTLQEKGREVARQQAGAQQLESSLQRVQEELQKSQRECTALRSEAQVLQHCLQDSREQEQRTAQELAQQKELVALAQDSLHHAQEELSEHAAKALRQEQAGWEMEAELRGLKDRIAGAEVELEQKRDLLEDLREELSQSEQRHQTAMREAKQHRQTAARLELELESSWEGLRVLEQQCQEEQQKAQSLQSTITEREAENQVLREQLKQLATQLEATQGDLERLQQQLQQQTAEARRQEATLSQLHTELHAAQEKEQQSSQALAVAKDIAQDLKQQVASCRANQREALGQLEERVREVSHLQADLQLSRHKAAHLEEELAAHREQIQQLRSQFQALQRQREEEARSLEGRLGELGHHVQHWQDEHRAAEQALAERDEELVVLKVELAALEEKWHTASQEREEQQAEVDLLRQKVVISSREVKTLQTALEGAHADTHHLRQESERIVAHVSQWAKEQKQAKEKLGHKIREQIKLIAQLTGERDHFQGLTDRLHQENKRLKNETDEWRIEQERLRALHSSAWDSCVGYRQPWPVEDPPCSCHRRSTVLTAKWDRP